MGLSTFVYDVPCCALIINVLTVHKLNTLVISSWLIIAAPFSNITTSTITFMCAYSETYPAFMSRLQKLLEYSLIADQWEA